MAHFRTQWIWAFVFICLCTVCFSRSCHPIFCFASFIAFFFSVCFIVCTFIFSLPNNITFCLCSSLSINSLLLVYLLCLLLHCSLSLSLSLSLFLVWLAGVTPDALLWLLNLPSAWRTPSSPPSPALLFFVSSLRTAPFLLLLLLWAKAGPTGLSFLSKLN